MNVGIKKLKPTAIIPEYHSAGAAAFDFHACIEQSRVIQPGERAVIPTGLALEIPDGYEMQVHARSGMSIKHGLTMVNGVGVIDADYRGELGLLVINLGQEPFEVEPDMRIAQGMIFKVDRVQWQELDELSETARGDGGYGSTGTSVK